MAKISIICLTYNQSDYIFSAFKGFSEQITDHDIELIIADDASTDNTTEIIESLAYNFSGEFKFIKHAKNIGFMENFISAIDQCTGDYIALCEGDDFWTDPYKLQTQIEEMQKFVNVTISFHPTSLVNKSGCYLGIHCQHANKNMLYRTEDILRYEGSFMPTASIIFRSDVFKNMLPKKRELLEQYTTAFMLQLLVTGTSEILFLNKNMASYRVMSTGSWSELITFDSDKFVEWSLKYIQSLKKFNVLSDGIYGDIINGLISNKHFSIMKNDKIDLCFKKGYFSENNQNMTYPQRLSWCLIKYIPGDYSVFRKIKRWWKNEKN